jgi:hypothetical protein
MALDGIKNYYDSLIIDHDDDSGVERVVVDQMDEVMVVLYPKRTVVSRKKKQFKSSKRIYFSSCIDIQIKCVLLV